MLTSVLNTEDTQVFICTPPVLERQERDIWLAQELEKALNVPLNIVRRASGRPALAPPHHELGLSMAKAGTVLAVGIGLRTSVGLDIEVIAAAHRMFETAQIHFHADEVAALNALREEERDEKSLQLWVMKEAILKLTGRGVFDGMSEPNLASYMNALDDEKPQFECIHHSQWHEPMSLKCKFKRVHFAEQNILLGLAQI